MNYYSGNDIYNYINSVNHCKFANDNFWLVIYGTKIDRKPRLIIALSGYETSEFKTKTLKPNEIEWLGYAKQISSKSNVPWIYVRFDKNNTKVSELKIMTQKRTMSLVNIDFYKSLLEYFGFTLVDKNTQSKEFNTGGPANIYQVWQMKISNDMISSDIDLIKVNNENLITDVYELKRSKISINSWEPFKADYHNFELLNHLFIKANIKFHITYNEFSQDENGRKDNIQNIKIFDVKPTQSFEFEKPSIINLHDFFKFY